MYSARPIGAAVFMVSSHASWCHGSGILGSTAEQLKYLRNNTFYQSNAYLIPVETVQGDSENSSIMNKMDSHV